MTPDEKKAFIETQTTKREALAKQLAEKAKQRDDYVKDQEAKTATMGAKEDSFDKAVSETLRKQVK